MNLNWAKLIPARADLAWPVNSDMKLVEIEKRVEVPVAVYTARPVLDVVDYIWLKESTRGKNNVPGSLADICEKQGKTNEYGYGGMALKICFDDKKEARALVLLWVEQHLEEYNGSVAKVLCHYNIGHAITTCPYAQGFN